MAGGVKVSVVIPVYNEALAIREILRRVCEAPLPPSFTREIIIVDDGSTDQTTAIIENAIKDDPKLTAVATLHRGIVNHGKGAAVRVGLKLAKGDIIIVQDGDLEYDPKDYPRLLAPFASPDTQIVFGSRFTTGVPKGMHFANAVANLILTLTTRILYGQTISDEATGFKVFRRQVLDYFDLKCLRFEFCPEFTAKVSLAGFKIHEVPISYNPRGILEGKKIRASDGFQAIWWLLKLRFTGKTIKFDGKFNEKSAI